MILCWIVGRRRARKRYCIRTSSSVSLPFLASPSAELPAERVRAEGRLVAALFASLDHVGSLFPLAKAAVSYGDRVACKVSKIRTTLPSRYATSVRRIDRSHESVSLPRIGMAPAKEGSR